MYKEPEISSDRPVVFYLLFLLVALVLFEKSLLKKKNSPEPVQSQTQSQNEVIEEAPNLKNSSILEDTNDVFANEETLQGIYFIKFYHVNQNSRSKLVKVQRTLKGSLKKRIKIALKELRKGPSSIEIDKGVLTSLPTNFKFNKKVKLIDGILHISVDENFEKNASKDLIQDRIDQLSYTLLEFNEIKGVKLYINEKEMNLYGKDKVSYPAILSKTNSRKVIFL